MVHRLSRKFLLSIRHKGSDLLRIGMYISWFAWLYFRLYVRFEYCIFFTNTIRFILLLGHYILFRVWTSYYIVNSILISYFFRSCYVYSW